MQNCFSNLDNILITPILLSVDRGELHEEAAASPADYDWLKMRPKEEDTKRERSTLAGSLQRDVALWFSLASVGAAWLPGPVTHREVMHAYAIVILWTVLHHSCRRATTWSAG